MSKRTHARQNGCMNVFSLTFLRVIGNIVELLVPRFGYKDTNQRAPFEVTS